jgi:hypothetical protein
MNRIFGVFIFILIIVLPFAVHAGVLKGRVLDTKSKALSKATLCILNKDNCVLSNDVGDYELTLDPGNYKIVCRQDGFKANVFAFTMSEDQDVTHDFIMDTLIIKDQSLDDMIDSLGSLKMPAKVIEVAALGVSWRHGADSFKVAALMDGLINFNPVEGVNVAPKVEWLHDLAKGKYLAGADIVRYGFSNRHFNAIGRLTYIQEDTKWRGRYWLVGGSFGKYVFQYDYDNSVFPLFNTISALFWDDNELKIYEQWVNALYVGRNYGNGLMWNAHFEYDRRLPLENTTDFSFADKGSDRYSSNVPENLKALAPWEVHNAALIKLSISYQPGYTYAYYKDYKIANLSHAPVFDLSYDKGIPDIGNSKVNFDKWKLMLHGNIDLKKYGIVGYNTGFGGFLNSAYVSIADLMHLYGNKGIGIASPYLYSFQFAQYYDFSNKEPFYDETHVEYNLNGFISNKLPGFKQAKINFLIGSNIFYARQSDYYTEAFFGLDNIGFGKFRYLRVDFVQSWDSHGGRNSGFRVGINTRSLVPMRQGNMNSNW